MNPTHGSVWMGSNPFYSRFAGSIPARFARRVFIAATRCRQDRNHPHSAVCGIHFRPSEQCVTPFCVRVYTDVTPPE